MHVMISGIQNSIRMLFLCFFSVTYHTMIFESNEEELKESDSNHGRNEDVTFPGVQISGVLK